MFLLILIVLLFGFVVGALTIVAAEAVGVYFVINWLDQKTKKKEAQIASQTQDSLRELDPYQSLDFANNKKVVYMFVFNFLFHLHVSAGTLDFFFFFNYFNLGLVSFLVEMVGNVQPFVMLYLDAKKITEKKRKEIGFKETLHSLNYTLATAFSKCF
jgi:hypothetical protein